MDNTLIRTKLQVPRVKLHTVQRQHLAPRLNDKPERTFTLVSAPAGFGKTTLIASWLASQQAPYAWISLDRFDNDLAVFLRYVVASIQNVYPESCAALWHSLQLPDLPPPATLTALVINAISQLPQAILLVLDDYHVIYNSDILQLVERILEQSQNRLHLVIISRIDPLLPLARLRVQQDMVEIRHQDLRFSDQEAENFLITAVSAPIDPQMANQLNQRVEGWIAGLHLVSISMQNPKQNKTYLHEIQGTAQDFIANYLFTEVLAQQPTDVQEFLIQTAFVDRFCADLCNQLVRYSSKKRVSQELIAYLQRTNLFIIPLDEQANWFRYHHLFQQMLQQKSTLQLDKTEILDLHNRAGSWFAHHGLVDEALQHYLSADDMETAVSLIEANSRNLLNSLARQRLERWMEMLPADIIWQRPRLLIAKAWLYYRHWQLQAVATVLLRVRELVEVETIPLEQDEQNFIMAQLFALDSAVAYYLDNDFDRSIQSAKQALTTLPPSEQGALGTALGYKILSLQAKGESETAVAQFNDALSDPSPQGPAWVQLYLSAAFLRLKDGDLLAFNHIVEQFIAAAATSPLGHTPANWLTGIGLYEADKLTAAHKAFSNTTDLHYSTNFLAACDSWLGLARICQEQGNLYQAQEYLETVRAEALRLGSTDLMPAIEGVQAYQHLLQGETAVALRWASAYQPDSAPDYPLLTFTPLFFWVRILVAYGDDKTCEAALHTIKAKLVSARKIYFVQRQIQLLAHLALLVAKSGDLEAACELLEEAVLLAEPGGFVRTFVDCGSALRPLLQQLQQKAIAPHYIAQLLATFPQKGINHSTPQPPELLLTGRETQILQMMYTGNSNKEIAQDLVISLYTVKRHASNIYRKLDVNGRRQAILKAKQIGIITST